jgi:hypothetical protein
VISKSPSLRLIGDESPVPFAEAIESFDCGDHRQRFIHSSRTIP